MNKNKRLKYTAERKEHYRMYKDGKRFVFAMVSALSFTTGVFLMSSHTVSADSNDSAETSSAVTTDKTSDSGGTTSDTAINDSETPAATTAQATAATTTDDTATTTTNDAGTSAASQTANDTGAQPDSGTTDTTGASEPAATTVKGETDATSATTSATDQATTATAPAQTATATAANTTTLVNPTDETLAATKASQATAYTTTGQAQRVTAVAAASSATATVTVTPSVATIGYNANISNFTLSVLYSNAHKDDVITVTVPGTSPVLNTPSINTITNGTATSTFTKNQSDGTYTLTTTFTADQASIVDQTITYGIFGNGNGQSNGMGEVGTTTKTINIAINNVAQTPVTFTQVISPKAAPSAPTRYYPTSGTVSAILPDTEYVYSYKINESDGVKDDTSQSAQVNSAVNYGGATVTVAVPAGFLLDTSATASINAFTDGTTITQPGGLGTNIVITAPAKAGTQGYQAGAGYLFVGSFKVTQSAVNQKITASSGSTFSQIVNAAGDTVTATGTTPWTETILGQSSTVTDKAAVGAYGNSSSASTSLLLDDDPTNDPVTLGSFVFSNNSPEALTDAHINISIPDGLDVTSFSVPAVTVSSQAYLLGTTSYKYVLTMSDGSTQEGTVDAGNAITRTGTAAIRQIVLSPNTLAPGATNTTSVLYNANATTGIKVMGSLSSTYDDGALVQVGDKLVETVTITVGDDPTVLATSSVTQTVTVPTAVVNAFNYQTSKVPGATNAGYLGLATAGSAGQTTDYIYEPILYYVLPTATSFSKVANTGDAAVSEFKADDGRTVVKIDYTGTGDSVYVTSFADQVYLNNNTDALPGNYQYFMYVVSPTTALMNTSKPTNLSYVENDSRAFTISGGTGNWVIDSAGPQFTIQVQHLSD